MALGIDWDDVVLIAPELSAVAAVAQTAILAAVDLQLHDTALGTMRDLCATYLAAHLGALTRRGGVSGMVTSESVGQVSRSYANSVAQGAGLYSSTVYGQEYERLLRMIPACRFDIG